MSSIVVPTPPPSGPIGTRPQGTLPDQYAQLGACLQRCGLDTTQVTFVLSQIRTLVDTAVVHAVDLVASTVDANHRAEMDGLRARLRGIPSYAGLVIASSLQQAIDDLRWAKDRKAAR